MCGIAIFSSGKHPVDETKLRWLLKENMSRGKDSTGVFTVKQDKNATQTLYKNVAQATIFIQQRGFKDAVRGATSVLGHTRGASVISTVANENAHPFEFGEGEDYLVGIHNGFIIPQLVAKTTKDFGFEKEFDVDSQLIFAALSKNHGDYRILSKIEGALTLAWMMPNKYPGTIFIYRREPRELNIGFTREGIYFSSTPEPLRFIGADSIWPVMNNMLLVIKDGMVLDMRELQPPKIKSLKLDCSRSYWEYSVPQDEYKDLVPELIKTSVSTNNRRSHNWSNFNEVDEKVKKIKTDIDAILREANEADEFGLLIKDIQSEIKGLELDPIKYNECVNSEIADTNSCLIILKIVDSIHQLPVPAVAVIDAEDPFNTAGITTLTGVTILKYDEKKCGKDHYVEIYGPIDNPNGYKLKLSPMSGRVMEITMTLPFDKKKGRSRNETENNTLFTFKKRSVRLGQTRNIRLASDFHKASDVRGPEGVLQNDIQEQNTQLFGPHSEGTSAGIQDSEGNVGIPLLPIEGLPKKDGIIQLTRKDVSSYLYNSDKYLSNDEETSAAFARWNRDDAFGVKNVVKVLYLVNDAGTLRARFKKERQLIIPIESYMIWLLQHFPQDYCKSVPIPKDDRTKLTAFLFLNFGTHTFPAPIIS